MVDKVRVEKAVKELLMAIGEDPNREGLLETPKRVAEMYSELFAGVDRDATSVAKMFNEEEKGDIVLVKEIPLYSMCEHHLLPFYGVANVGYIPQGDKVLGLSKVARIVDVLSKKPQLQERLTNEIADVIAKVTGAKGVYVSIECEHLCMTMRGIRKPGAKTITVATRGNIATDPMARAEMASFLRG